MNTLTFQNGDSFPPIGLGTYLSKKNEVYEAVLTAIRVGYRHIDCAYIYDNEAEIGRALQFAFESGLVQREELFITSKLWNSYHSPELVEVAIRKSLQRLQLDYLDLYLMHWPIAFKAGCRFANDVTELVSLEEIPVLTTWQAMERIQQVGLVKHIGVSNFNIPKLQQLLNTATLKPEVNQVELHPYLQQGELVEFCQENKVLVTAYSPLGSRHLINGSEGIGTNSAIVAIANKHNCKPTQVVLAWGMARGTAVIPKSITAERIQENVESLNVKLDNADMKLIASLDRNLRMAKGLYCVFPNGYYTYENIWNE